MLRSLVIFSMLVAAVSATGEKCNWKNGDEGTCMDSDECGGDVESDNCPGAKHIRCCVDQMQKPTQKCKMTDDTEGTCMYTQMCGGKTQSGRCPGTPLSVSCCSSPWTPDNPPTPPIVDGFKPTELCTSHCADFTAVDAEYGAACKAKCFLAMRSWGDRSKGLHAVDTAARGCSFQEVYGQDGNVESTRVARMMALAKESGCGYGTGLTRAVIDKRQSKKSGRDLPSMHERCDRFCITAFRSFAALSTGVCTSACIELGDKMWQFENMPVPPCEEFCHNRSKECFVGCSFAIGVVTGPRPEHLVGHRR